MKISVIKCSVRKQNCVTFMKKLTWLFILFFLFVPTAGAVEPEAEIISAVETEKTAAPVENKAGIEQSGTMTSSPAGETIAKAPAMELTPGSLSPDLFWSSIKSVGALICVLAVILAGTYFLKRAMPSRFGALGSQKMMQILESATLGDKRSLHLVKIRDSYILIGSTPTQVALLETFPEIEGEVEPQSPEVKKQLLRVQNSSQEKKSRTLFSWFKSDQGRPKNRQNAGVSFNEIMEGTVKAETGLAGVKDGNPLNRLAAIRESLEAQ